MNEALGNAPKLALQDFEGRTTNEDIVKFLGCSLEELTVLKNQAMQERRFIIAGFIEKVIETKNNGVGKRISENFGKESGAIAATLNDTAEKKIGNQKRVELYKKQLKTSQRLNEYFKEKKIKFYPENISFYGNNIIYCNIRNNYIIKDLGNGTYEDLPILQDKILFNDKIRSIKKLGDYYEIEIVKLDKNRNVKTENDTRHYIVDGNGELLPQLGKQTGKEYFQKYEGNESLIPIEYIYRQLLKDSSIKKIYFDKNMNVIAESPDQNLYGDLLFVYNDRYLYSYKDNIYGREKYVICSQRGDIIAEGTKSELNDDCLNEYIRTEKIKKEKINNMASEEKDLEKYGYIIDEENGALTIKDKDGKEIYFIKNIKDLRKYNSFIEFYIENDGCYKIEIGNNGGNTSDKDSNLILITHKKGDSEKNIFKNTKTGKELSFDDKYSFLHYSLIKHFINSTCSEIYDQDFKLLGTIENDIGDKNFIFIVKTKDEENGEDKYYAYSKKTGKKLTECKSTNIVATYKNGKNEIYIIEQPNGELVQVEG